MVGTEGVLAGVRPEDRLLLACARTTIDDATGAQIARLVAAGVDWGELLVRAGRHRVIPLLCRSLSITCLDLVPGAIQERLQQGVRAIKQRNLLLTGELFRIL